MRIEAVLALKGWELMTNATTVLAIFGQIKQKLQHIVTDLETIKKTTSLPCWKRTPGSMPRTSG